ncbi:thioredoxin-like protein [Phakopsora pachyrhizi]|uniref:Thioredoxin-like protein n=1 Tax=Phakopsora pachyrhizi TaxID=170000 RepID=A0AAV0AFF8_PHAPC|nr:thioredoxin-like protein [Phakopsora pachyrhizi]
MAKKRSIDSLKADGPAPRRSSRIIPVVKPIVKSTKKLKTSDKPTKPRKKLKAQANSMSPLSDLSSELSSSKNEKENGDLKDKKQQRSFSLKSLKVGDSLSEKIVLKNQEDKEVEVLELLKDKGAVFFLYPKANTPGCTTQACGYRDIYKEITDTGFQQKLPYPLLCDPKQQLIKLLGGSKSATQVQRSHYILDKGGKILDIKSPASTKNSATEALEFIKSK